MTPFKRPEIGPLVWSGCIVNECGTTLDPKFDPRFKDIEDLVRKSLDSLWETELQRLSDKVKGKGKGQLVSSAPRIRSFISFTQSQTFQEIRSTWLNWRAKRDATRIWYFQSEGQGDALRSAYTDNRRVAVLLGGPPCQGFSRIGRGKIRSLSDHKVHVQYDPDSGDVRNKLLNRYVMFLGALRPGIFLFENVEHFKTEVKTSNGVFRATDILAEAIEAATSDHSSYNVHSAVLRSSQLGIPQTRDRFFMAGVRSDLEEHPTIDLSEWCLSMPREEEVPLSCALSGLAAPYGPKTEGGLAKKVTTTLQLNGHGGSSRRFVRWIRQPDNILRQNKHTSQVDAHCARVPRDDDAELFSLFGPGKRWMDYRSDSAPTLRRVSEAIQILLELSNCSNGSANPKIRELLGRVDSLDVKSLQKALDGSLPIRLLLETISPLPGELQHHLLADVYLRKKNGNHGDWLARLDLQRPCKTVVSHMGKDTYAYVHPVRNSTISVREAARVQSFPDWFSFAALPMVDAYRMIGNAVPPLLSNKLAGRVAQILQIKMDRKLSKAS